MKDDNWPGKGGFMKRLKDLGEVDDPPKAEPSEEERLAQREARQKEQEAYAAQATFNAWDYALLESIRRGDPRLRIRMGTMRALACLEKLFRAGWIEKPSSEMPFDDMERLEAFRDSHEYKQYEDRLARIMPNHHRHMMYGIFDMVGIKRIDDWLVLTEGGKRKAKEKRDRLELVWSRMRKLYSKGMTAEFRQESEKNVEYLPLFVMMGLVNGATMSRMMSEASVDCPYWYGDLYGGGPSGAWGGSGGFDCGFDFGDC